MGKEAVEGMITVITAIVGLGIIAVLVSKNANTTGVLQAGGSALSSSIAAATAPVTGSGAFGMGSLANQSTGWTGNAPISSIYI